MSKLAPPTATMGNDDDAFWDAVEKADSINETGAGGISKKMLIGRHGAARPVSFAKHCPRWPSRARGKENS
jgi:hypothetical protein